MRAKGPRREETPKTRDIFSYKPPSASFFHYKPNFFYGQEASSDSR
jgi:hypothetical protein